MRVLTQSQQPGALISLPVRIAALGASQPEAVAVRCGTFEQTFAELAGLAARGARRLADCGCGVGDRVALLGENHPLYIAAFLAIVGRGACAATIPTAVPAGNVAQMLSDSGARVLIVSDAMTSLARDALGLLTDCDITVLTLSTEDREARSAFASPAEIQTAECVEPFADLAAEFNIVYSSGTTGTPKGILHSHRTRATLASGFSGLGFDVSAVTLVSTPLYTNMSIPAFLGTLWGGGTVEVVLKFDPQEYLKLASRVRATHFFLVPAQVVRLLQQPNFPDFDLGNTRLKYVAGSKLQPSLKERLLTLWPGELIEVYGMSEGAPFTALFASAHRDKLDSVGMAPPGATVRIIDDEGRDLPAGAVGEIVGRSGSMMIGYNNRPQETEALLWRDAQGEIYFRSGDIGRLDSDGFLYVVDRKKDVIISGGYNVYGSDLEEVLLSHSEVDQAAVVGVESDRWGESPVAFVVLKHGAALSAPELQSWVNKRVGKFQRLARVELRHELPRNALGKVMKRELRDGAARLP